MSQASTATLPPPPSLLRPRMPRWAAVAIACVSSFMVVMDGAIVNVALPSIQADLNLSGAELQWVLDAYLLALGGFMLLAARASDLFGRKRILQGGLLVFTLASLAGGFAQNASHLLLARAVQGFGASALATSTLAVIVAVHGNGPGRARAISWWAASSAVASAFGVVAGGLLTAWMGWRWVMFVNVPIGLALMAGVVACLLPAQAAAQRPRLDITGAVTVTLGMGALMLGISQSLSLGWGSGTVQLELAAGVLLLALFWIIESRSTAPLIRPDIFRIPNVTRGNVVVLCLGAALTSASFFTSLALQRVLNYNAQDTGLAMLPMGLALAVAAIVSRPLMDAGERRLPFFGGLTSAAGLVWLSALPASGGFAAHVLGPTLLTGLGLGLMLMTATHTALDGVPGKDAGLASGLFNTARQLGAALGIAGLSALMHWQGTLLAGCRAAFLATAALSTLAALVSLSLQRKA